MSNMFLPRQGKHAVDSIENVEIETCLMKLSFVAKDIVSLFNLCSRPEPMPNATVCRKHAVEHQSTQPSLP